MLPINGKVAGEFSPMVINSGTGYNNHWRETNEAKSRQNCNDKILQQSICKICFTNSSIGRIKAESTENKGNA